MACADGQILKYDLAADAWKCAVDNTGAGAGSVTSVTAGVGLTGGTITGTGTIGLGTELTAVNALSTTGVVQRTGAGSYSTVTANAAASANTLVQRDGAGASAFNAVEITGTTSGTLTLNAPATVTPYTLTLPAAQGGANQLLSNDGSGVLSWVSALTNTLSSGQIFVGNGSNLATGVAMSGDATLSNSGALTLANSGVTAGTYSKVTVDAKGRVIASSSLTTSDITAPFGTPTDGQLLIGNGSGLTLANLTAGTGISVTNSAGGITISATSSGSVKDLPFSRFILL